MKTHLEAVANVPPINEGRVGRNAGTLVLYPDLGDTLRSAQCCEGIAFTLIAMGWPKLAVRLLAAAEPIRQALAIPLSPSEATLATNAIEAARTALGDAKFAAAWAAGGALSPAQTVAAALALTVHADPADAGESGNSKTI